MKTGYRKTELGVIPDDWECVRIASIARLESGHTPSRRKPTYWDGKIPWVSLHDTDGLNDREIFTTAKMITEEGLNNSSARMLPKGTVVFSRTATVGKATVLGRDMATSQDFANYVCGPRLHNYFLLYLFRGMGRTWKALMAGSIHNTIYMPVFKALQIVLPPFAEQRAIAEALSDVDELLGALDRLIAKKRDIKQAAMQQLLTGQTRLPGFHGDWQVKRLGEDITLLSGHHVLAQYCNTKSAGVPYLTGPADFPEGRIRHTRFTERPGTMCQPNDILVTVKGSGSGTIIIADSGYCISRQLMAVRTGKWDFRFIYFSLLQNASQFKAASTGLIPGLSRSDILDQPLPMPASTLEQVAIAEALTDMDAELTALEQRRDKTRALKQGMTQELLTGKTRLVAPELVAHA